MRGWKGESRSPGSGTRQASPSRYRAGTHKRTADKGILFYSYGDCLEYFTLYCLLARKYRIRVCTCCLMLDHVHDALSAKQSRCLESIKRDLNTHFSNAYNKRCGIKGPLLESPFGSAVKQGAKRARNTIIYVGNNPVERQLVTKAEEYRWNFVAYAESSHPFSEKLVIRDARWPLQQAVREVRAQHAAGNYLPYALLQRLFIPLNAAERQQLTDYIVSTYNVIDYPYALQFFDGSYENMLTAMHSTTGHEYDLNETFTGISDKYYYQMAALVKQEAGLIDIHELLPLDLLRKQKLFQLLKRRMDCPAQQIAKFLHLPLQFGQLH